MSSPQFDIVGAMVMTLPAADVNVVDIGKWPFMCSLSRPCAAGCRYILTVTRDDLPFLEAFLCFLFITQIVYVR